MIFSESHFEYPDPEDQRYQPKCYSLKLQQATYTLNPFCNQQHRNIGDSIAYMMLFCSNMNMTVALRCIHTSRMDQITTIYLIAGLKSRSMIVRHINTTWYQYQISLRLVHTVCIGQYRLIFKTMSDRSSSDLVGKLEE